MREPVLCLTDILRAMDAIESFILGMDFETFSHNLKTKSAVLAKLALMGEASKILPVAIRADNPGVAWKNMAGMRDRLIHGYFQVDFALVWQTITQTLPIEKRLIQEIIERLPQSQP